MPHAMEADEPLDPVGIGAFGAQTVMFEPHDIAHLLEQPFWLVHRRLQRHNGGHDSAFIRPFPRKQAD